MPRYFLFSSIEIKKDCWRVKDREQSEIEYYKKPEMCVGFCNHSLPRDPHLFLRKKTSRFDIYQCDSEWTCQTGYTLGDNEHHGFFITNERFESVSQYIL